MKYFILILSCLLYASAAISQENIEKLKSVDKEDSVTEGHAVIYGLFVQRLEKKSAGYPQYICIENTSSHHLYMFQVKPTMTADRENVFCYHILPGTYRIVSYYWVINNWYGGKAHTEPVYKGIKVDKDFNRRLEKGDIKEDDLKSYTITIRPNSINYLGTWHFDTEPATFSNDRDSLNTDMADRYPNLDFRHARTTLPR